jgi:hypothetical protein
MSQENVEVAWGLLRHGSTPSTGSAALLPPLNSFRRCTKTCQSRHRDEALEASGLRE